MKNTPDLMSRGGRFKIPATYLRNGNMPKGLLEFMSKVFTVRCEQHFATDTLHYSALSPCFCFVEDGVEWPEYIIEVCGARVPCRCDNCAPKPTFTVRKL